MRMMRVIVVAAVLVIIACSPSLYLSTHASHVNSRKIVVISNETHISMGILKEGVLYPFPDPETQEAAVIFGESVTIEGQLVDGEYMPVWSSSDAFMKNKGVKEDTKIRWWFGDREMPPVEVSGCNGIKGFFKITFIVDDEISPSPGKYRVRFDFEGVIKRYEGIGEFMIYPPCSLEFNITVIFSADAHFETESYTASPANHAVIRGHIYGRHNEKVDALMSVDFENTYPGVFIDDATVIDDGTVIYNESFERSNSVSVHFPWSVGVKNGTTCLGTFNGLPGLSAGTASLKGIKLTSAVHPVLKLRVWMNMSENDFLNVYLRHGGLETDAVKVESQQRKWDEFSIPLKEMRWKGLNRTVLGYDDVEIIFRVESRRYLFMTNDGNFYHILSVPYWREGSYSITVRYSPLGYYADGAEKLHLKIVRDVKIEFLKSEIFGAWLSVDFMLKTDDSRVILDKEVLPNLWGFVRSLSGSVINGNMVMLGDFYRFACYLEGVNDDSYDVYIYFNGTSLYAPAYFSKSISKELKIEVTLAATVFEDVVHAYGFVMMGDSGLAEKEVRLRAYSSGELIEERTASTDKMGRFEITIPVSWSTRFIRIVASCENITKEVRVGYSRVMHMLYDSMDIRKGVSYISGRILDDSGNGVAYLPLRLYILLPQKCIDIGSAYTFPDGKFHISFTYNWRYPAEDVKIRITTPYGNILDSVINARVYCKSKVIPSADIIHVNGSRMVVIEGRVVEDWDGKDGYPITPATIYASLDSVMKTVRTDSYGCFSVAFPVHGANITYMCTLKYGGNSVYSKSTAEVVVKVHGGYEMEKTTVKKMEKREDNDEKIASAGVVASFISLILVVLFAENAKLKVLFLFIPLYSKIKKEEVLDLFTRGQVYGYIKTHPGDHFNEIKRQLGLSNGTLSYHLRVLENQDYVWSRSDGIYRRYYPSEVHRSREMRRLSGSETQKTIMKIIDKNPGITPREISRIMKTSHQVISYHVKMLSKDGRVHVKKKGKKKLCYPDGHRD